MPPVVAFDVLGTCFTLDKVIEATEASLGDYLASNGSSAKGVVLDWFHSTQRDFTYLSMCDSYTPMASVFTATLSRTLSKHLDLPPVRHFIPNSPEPILAALKQLTPFPGLKEALQVLRAHGVKIYFVTNGARDTTIDYIRAAGLQNLVDNVLSCDDVPRGGNSQERGVAKPDPRVYAHALRRIKDETGVSSGPVWFCAAHAWDLVGAKKAGFRTAYTLHEERVQPLEPDIFERMQPDVVGRELVETVDALLAVPSSQPISNDSGEYARRSQGHNTGDAPKTPLAAHIRRTSSQPIPDRADTSTPTFGSDIQPSDMQRVSTNDARGANSRTYDQEYSQTPPPTPTMRATSAAFLPTVPSAGPDLQASHSHTGRLPPTAFNQRPQHGQANAHVPSSNAPVRITGVPVGRSSLESQPGPPGSTAFSGQSGWSGTGSQPSRPHLVQSNRSAASSPLPRSADLPASMANGKMSGDTKSSSLAMQQPQQPQTQRSAPPSRPIVVQRGSQEHGDGWANPNNARTQPGRPDARTSPSSSKRR